MRKLIGIILIAIFLGSSTYASGKEDIAQAIKAVVLKNLKATEAEDLDLVMQTIHTQSPAYVSTKQQIPPSFENFDLKYELLSLKYIGYDGEYAVVRTKQSTQKISGPAFQNNEIDMIQVFKKEADKWKFWNQAILEIKFTNK
jgi:hypothetical protein